MEDVAFAAAGLTARAGLKPERVGQLRIAVLREPYPGQAEPEAVVALDRAMAALEKAGHTVRDLPTPPQLQQLARLQRLVMAYEMDKSLGDERRRHEAKLSSILKTYLDEGRAISARAYDGALAATREVMRDIDGVFGDADVILSPPAPGEAPCRRPATPPSTGSGPSCSCPASPCPRARGQTTCRWESSSPRGPGRMRCCSPQGWRRRPR